MRTLVWFRNDLRTADNPALADAMRRGEAVAAFCICNAQWRSHDVGDNRLAFLLDSLHALADDLRAIGVPLRLITEPHFGDVPQRLLNLAVTVSADGIAFNEEYPLNERLRDSEVARAFDDAGRTVRTFHGGVLQAPGSVLTNNGDPYTVYTPFKRRWFAQVSSATLELLPTPRAHHLPHPGASAVPLVGVEELLSQR